MQYVSVAGGEAHLPYRILFARLVFSSFYFLFFVFFLPSSHFCTFVCGYFHSLDETSRTRGGLSIGEAGDRKINRCTPLPPAYSSPQGFPRSFYPPCRAVNDTAQYGGDHRAIQWSGGGQRYRLGSSDRVGKKYIKIYRSAVARRLRIILYNKWKIK